MCKALKQWNKEQWNEKLSFFQRLFNILKQGFSTRISNILDPDFRKACFLAEQYKWTINWGKYFFLNLPWEELKNKEFKIQDLLEVEVYCLQKNTSHQEEVYKKKKKKTLEQWWTISLKKISKEYFYRKWWSYNSQDLYFFSYSSWNNDLQEIILDNNTFSEIIKKLIWYDWFINTKNLPET